MKKLKLIFPYVIAIIIICAGYFGVDAIKNFMPSHKETVRVFEKPDKNNLFYIGESDEIIIYPWDIFNEKQCISVAENFDIERYDDTVNRLKENIAILENDFFVPDEKFDFTPKVLYDGKIEIYFIKDYVFKNVYGEDCILSYVFTEKDTLYFHCELYNNKALTSDEIQSGKLKITNYINELIKSEQDSSSYDVESGQKQDDILNYTSKNPLEYFSLRALNLSSRLPVEIYSPTNLRYMFIRSSPIIIPQKGELLLIYYIDNTQIVLFYNPHKDLISGISIK